MRLAASIASFFLLVMLKQNGYIKCTKDDNNLTYRLMMFPPPELSIPSLKHVNEEVDDVPEDEAVAYEELEDDDAARGGDNGDEATRGTEKGADDEEEAVDEEAAEAEEEENENESPNQSKQNVEEYPSSSSDYTNSKYFRPNVLPRMNSSMSEETYEHLQGRYGLNKVKNAKPSYKDEVDAKTNKSPYSFEIPNDFQKEVTKLEFANTMPRKISKSRKISNSATKPVIEVDEESHQYVSEKKRVKKKKLDKRKTKQPMKKDKSLSVNIVDKLPFDSINPTLQYGEDQVQKEIRPRDVSLRIRSNNPMPVFVRHFRPMPVGMATWPVGVGPVAPVGRMNHLGNAAANGVPVVNHRHLHTYGRLGGKKPGRRRRKPRKKVPRKKPGGDKVQTNIVYHKQLSSDVVSCADHQDDYPKKESTADSQHMYNNYPHPHYPHTHYPHMSGGGGGEYYDGDKIYQYPMNHNPNSQVANPGPVNYYPIAPYSTLPQANSQPELMPISNEDMRLREGYDRRKLRYKQQIEDELDEQEKQLDNDEDDGDGDNDDKEESTDYVEPEESRQHAQTVHFTGDRNKTDTNINSEFKEKLINSTMII